MDNRKTEALAACIFAATTFEVLHTIIGTKKHQRDLHELVHEDTVESTPVLKSGFVKMVSDNVTSEVNQLSSTGLSATAKERLKNFYKDKHPEKLESVNIEEVLEYWAKVTDVNQASWDELGRRFSKEQADKYRSPKKGTLRERIRKFYFMEHPEKFDEIDPNKVAQHFEMFAGEFAMWNKLSEMYGEDDVAAYRPKLDASRDLTKSATIRKRRRELLKGPHGGGSFMVRNKGLTATGLMMTAGAVTLLRGN